MKHSTNTFEIDSLGELLVGFDYDIRKDTGEHLGHNIVDESTIELTSVEIVFCGLGIDILNQLNDKQKYLIIKKLEIL